MSAKMKTLEEQHQDYQRHIAVLKESLCAKEEHYNMLQADVSMIFRFSLRYFVTSRIDGHGKYDCSATTICCASDVFVSCFSKRKEILKSAHSF